MSCSSSNHCCPDVKIFKEEICGNYSSDSDEGNTVWQTYTTAGVTPGPFETITVSVYADTTSTPVVVEVTTPTGADIVLTPPGEEIEPGTTKSFTLPAVNAVNIHAVAAGELVTGKYCITLYRKIR